MTARKYPYEISIDDCRHLENKQEGRSRELLLCERDFGSTKGKFSFSKPD